MSTPGDNPKIQLMFSLDENGQRTFILTVVRQDSNEVVCDLQWGDSVRTYVNSWYKYRTWFEAWAKAKKGRKVPDSLSLGDVIEIAVTNVVGKPPYTINKYIPAERA